MRVREQIERNLIKNFYLFCLFTHQCLIKPIQVTILIANYSFLLVSRFEVLSCLNKKKKKMLLNTFFLPIKLEFKSLKKSFCCKNYLDKIDFITFSFNFL